MNRFRSVSMLVLGLLASLTFPFVNPSLAQIDPGGGVGGGPIAGSLDVTVIDGLTGDPLPGAFCQVGTNKACSPGD